MTTNNPPASEKHSLEKRMKADFRVFLTLLWKEMKLPKPTRMQLLVADTLQKSKDRLLCILGYRGMAKTYISDAYICWMAYKDPSLKFAIWAANQENAGDSTKLILDWVTQIKWLRHLAPTGSMDQSKLSFDFTGKGLSRGSSVSARGITGGVTGTRADILLIDDPETSSNGDTAKRRIQIDRAMGEAVQVMTQLEEGDGEDEGKLTRVIVLGTVHFDDSLYLRLIHQGYKMYLFPICVPSLDTQKMCWDYYLPPLQKMMQENPVGTPLDRFGPDEIELRRAVGSLSFERQNLVNPFKTSLSHKPFNLGKIIVFQADTEKLPIRFYQSPQDDHIANDIMGFSSASLSDKLYHPHKWDETLKPYDRKFVWVDPAGGGSNEIAFGVLGLAAGYAVLFHIEGLIGGSTEPNLERILEVARKFKVDVIYNEDNFGQGMFSQLLRSTQLRKYGRFGKENNLIPIEGIRNTKKKETRIANAIDPVINSGKLIITPECFQIDYESANIHQKEDKMCYRLSYQLSYFSETGNQLPYDDRIDTLGSLLEQGRHWLTEHPQDAADTWDDWIIRKAFEKDENQFLPDRGLDTTVLGSGKNFLKPRRTFIK